MEEGRQQNAGYLNASAAAERLQRNVNREHFLCTDFLLAFWQVTVSHPRQPLSSPDMKRCVGSSQRSWRSGGASSELYITTPELVFAASYCSERECACLSCQS